MINGNIIIYDHDYAFLLKFNLSESTRYIHAQDVIKFEMQISLDYLCWPYSAHNDMEWFSVDSETTDKVL